MLAKVFRSIFSLKPQQASDRSISSGERQSPKSLTPDLLKMLEKGDEDALRYPPYIRGFPAFISGGVLLDYHKDKVGLIASGIGLPPKQFNELILPVLTSYADFVHLVPASQNHHHRAWGGLLAHGLEVALMALNTCQTTSFDHGRVPQDRTRRKERWYAAAVFASLLHDTGKPLSDFKITDESGEISWKPVSKSIPEWAREVGIERYYLHWNPGRHERHKNLSITMVDRILNPDVREWLMDGGQDLYSAMVAAITGENEKSTLTGIIIKSDSQSVAQDLKKHGGDPAGAAVGGTGVPIASQVINAMRLLRQNEVWTANERGARIWSTTQGIFIAWNAAVSEVVEKMLADGLKAFPRSADSLGEILADHDVFERNPNGSGSIYWKVAPDILSVGKDKVLRLQCVKLSSPSTLYPFDPLPPPVAVEIGDDKSAVRYDPANGGIGLAIGEMGEGGAIDLAAEVSADLSAEDDKPMFDLDGGVTAPLPSAPAPGGFSAPALVTKPVVGVDAKKGKQGSSPSLVRDPEPQSKPGLVIGAPAPTLAPAPKPVTTEDRGAKPSVAGSSLFAGIKIGADAPEFEEEEKAQLMPPKDIVWEDPFAATELQLDGDPFSPGETTRKPQPAVLAEKLSTTKAGAAQPKRQTAPDVKPTEAPKTLSSMPGLQIGTKAPTPLPAAEEDARNNPLEQSPASPGGFETVEITGDFDPEILEMAGIEQAFAEIPVKARETPHEVTSPVETSKASPAQKLAQICKPANHGKPAAPRKVDFAPIPVEAFEDEFRFDAEHAVLDAFDVPAPPIKSPLGVTAPEELSGLDLSSFSLQEAPQDVSLHGFDLPSLDANVFIGGKPVRPIVQLGAIEDLECDEAHDCDPEDQVSEAVGSADVAEPEMPAAPSKRRRRKKKKKDGFVVPMPPMDLGAPVAAVPMPGINIGPARKPKTTPQPIVKMSDSAPPSRKSLELKEPVRLPQSAYQAFLNRHPDLAAKFLWYAENVATAIRLYKRHHPLFLFKDGGFQAEDVAALNEAHWLWFDLTSPERLVYSANGDKGVVLITFLVDALAEFSEGKFNIGVSRPESSLSDDEMGRIARSAIERVAVNTESYATPVVVFTPKLVTSISADLGIREPDLIRALIETQQMVLDRKNYIVSVEARAVSYE